MSGKQALIDEATIFVQGGDGGDGCVAFRREKHVPRGGPSGGNGGRGGHVILRADPRIRTLIAFTRKRHYRAESGARGLGGRKQGRRGEDLVVRVPVGTVLVDADSGQVLADLAEAGAQCLVARGGKGGRGNAAFADAAHQAPSFAERGEPGEKRRLRLELKLLADAGIIGLPNVGKSSLLARVSAARPKIADYPFTTLAPNLGIVRVDEENSFVMADLPGLVEGAHRGLGRGFDFLRHVERTRVLVHVLDMAAEDRDPIRDFEVICRELAQYSERLTALPQIVAANKIDLPGARQRAAQVKKVLARRRVEVFPVSALTGEGVAHLIGAVARQIEAIPRPAAAAEPAFFAVPRDREITVERDGAGRFVVRGESVERLVAKTALDNEDAVARLQASLERMGVMRKLREAGAGQGSKVAIGGREFDFLD